MDRHVLFICVRNRVRSVFAEFYLRKLLKEKLGQRSENINISSAGFFPDVLRVLLEKDGIPPPNPFFNTDMSVIVRRLLREKDIIVPDEWRSKQLNHDLVSMADVIVTALPWQKEEIAMAYPKMHGDILTFREIAEWEEPILFEKMDGLPMDDTFWDFCEENTFYVTKVVKEVELLVDRGWAWMIERLGVI